MRAISLLFITSLAACAAQAPDPDAEVTYGGKADDARPSAPDEIPEGYHLLIPEADAPDWDGDGAFSFCGNRSFETSFPLDLSSADAELACEGGGSVCLRAPLEGEMTDPELGAPIVFDGEGTATWSVSVFEGSRDGSAAITPGIYTLDVRLPQIHSLPIITARGRRAAPGFPRMSAIEATYHIGHAHGVDEVTVDLEEQKDAARWASLGVFRFDAGDLATITLEAEGRPVPASAVRLRRLPDPNLTDASWLSFIAANQYAHFWSLGPALGLFGFGNPGEGERWKQCAEDRRQLRWDEWHSWEAGRGLRGDEVESIGPCVADWWRSEHSATARAGTVHSLTAQFEQFLLQVPREGQHIQFFSGGQLEDNALEQQAASTQALFAYHPERDIALIAFRGTELENGQLLYDVAADLDFSMRDLPPPFDETWGRAHSGFVAALAQVEDALMEKVEALSPSTQIFVTGHSLGGALATLMAARILAEMEASGDLGRYRLGGLYTFGSPRVGDRELASRMHSLSSRTWVQLARVRNANDAVTRIPIDLGAIADYEHVGPMLYIDEDGLLELAPAVVSSRFSGRAIEDHDITAYYGHLLAGRDDPRMAAYDTCDEPF